MLEFLRTKPPVFKGLGTPLDVEDWMRTMERKLEITQCSDGEKVRFTVQQLEGAALDWYENLRGGLDDPEALTFEEFRAAYRDYYVPAGIKELKKEEFRTLQQDNKTIQQYLTQFTTLARYEPEDVARDADHQRHFLKGRAQEAL
ncbi:hypothetical protein E2562_033038 [Oryza meyeriana var. granulata]|uniref:Retrotransposon gag domain-containing protein n=1 Tax=Oryza meyeriana var. granulata TaxID=110450 RepID=A0A6G1CJB9_9ORYZ|nr:hypothetical protein E2562_033038 [Oryza meyeriana var. granulata]